jgi:voltage-gated sodium channel
MAKVAPAPAEEEVLCKTSQSVKTSPSKGGKKRASVPDGFTDPDVIKEQVREVLADNTPAESYSVFNFYWETGYFQHIAKHPVFENATLAVISLNAIYIAIDTDWNKAGSLTEADWYFQIMEHLFCVYFTLEWFVRFCAFRNKCDCRKDAWFVFDSALVFMMVMETWVVTAFMAISGQSGGSPLGGNTAILRLFRLLRLSRLMRMMRSFPELLILVKGMMQAMTSVAYVMGLLVIITYVFAIAFTQLSVGKEIISERYFPNVAIAMYSLFIYATFLDDLSVYMDDLRHDMWPLVFLSLLFICLAALTVMNMLVGVLCEVVSETANREKQELVTAKVYEEMREIAQDLDQNMDAKISYKEFSNIVENKKALKALEEVGVNPVGIIDLAELFFFDEGEQIELEFDGFMEMILDLRSSNSCKVKDVLNIWRRIKFTTNSELDNLNGKIDRVKKKVEEGTDRINDQVNDVLGLIRKIAAKPKVAAR